jgi:phospholipase/carboxylesterase
VGLHRAAGVAPAGGPAGGGAGEPRGGFTLYVPERTDGRRALPLVVALHGGMGSGSDFVWTWLREARSRGFLLLAPTSRGSTWSLHAPELDARPLRAMLDFVASRWPVDRERVLLTGLSDGGTFALLAGLGEDAPWTALAPVAGVLHPLVFATGGLARARRRRILWVHGARDWMFPIALARAGRDALAAAGAEVELREVPDLSHAYPREENDRILAWFDPELARPADPA